MNIALLGIRGVPARYSGFETCAEEVGARLVERGHRLTVYCRSTPRGAPMSNYRGMRLITLPTLRTKHLETIVHTLLSALHALTQSYDAVLFFGVGNSPLAVIPWLKGQGVALNVDGLDWQRDKWSPLARRYLRGAEWLAAHLPITLIADARVIQDYYARRYSRATEYIAYGASLAPCPPGALLERLGLQPRRYILFVGRLEPENCAHHLVSAVNNLDTDMRCVIVGDAPYARDYIRSLRASAGESVVFTGFVFGDEYRELLSNAYVFVETSAVGGTHPALLEAMCLGNAVVVNDTPANLEVIQDAGIPYRGSEGAAHLREVLARLIADPELTARCRLLARERARAYSWDAVTDAYERVLRQL